MAQKPKPKPQPQPKPPGDLIEAAKTGDRLQTLIALRDLLAERLQHTESSRDIASMSRRLMQAIAEIEDLEKIKKAAEESPFSLYEFRKQVGLARENTKKQYKRNAIGAEHEND